jgi:hypothetical protein
MKTPERAMDISINLFDQSYSNITNNPLQIYKTTVEIGESDSLGCTKQYTLQLPNHAGIDHQTAGSNYLVAI